MPRARLALRLHCRLQDHADFVLDFIEALVVLSGGAAVDCMFHSGATEFTVILTTVRLCLRLRPRL